MSTPPMNLLYIDILYERGIWISVFQSWSKRSAVSIGFIPAKDDIMCTAGLLSIHLVTVMLSGEVATHDEPRPLSESVFTLVRCSSACLSRLDLKVPTT